MGGMRNDITIMVAPSILVLALGRFCKAAIPANINHTPVNNAIVMFLWFRTIHLYDPSLTVIDNYIHLSHIL